MAEAVKALDSSEVTEAPKPSKELNKSNSARELVFGIVGHVGSGTSTVANDLCDILASQTVDEEQQEAVILKARSVIEGWAKANTEDLPTDDTPKMEAVSRFQDLGDKMRAAGDHAAVARGLIRLIREQRATFQGTEVAEEEPVNPDGKPRAYVLDSLRHPAEVHLLRRVYGDAFVLVGVFVRKKLEQSEFLTNTLMQGLMRLVPSCVAMPKLQPNTGNECRTPFISPTTSLTTQQVAFSRATPQNLIRNGKFPTT